MTMNFSTASGGADNEVMGSDTPSSPDGALGFSFPSCDGLPPEQQQRRELPSAEPFFAREMIADVARRHRISPTDILSAKRDRRTFFARREVIVRLRARNWSSPRIGMLLRRDHSTVLSALRGVQDA